MEGSPECDVNTDSARYLQRRKLVDSALEQTAQGVVVIGAPCGYGKSWLARQLYARLWRRNPSGNGAIYLQINSHKSKEQVALNLITQLNATENSVEEINPDRLHALLDTQAELPAFIIDLDGPPPSRSVRTFTANLLATIAPRTQLVVACRRPEHLALSRLELLRHVAFIGAKSLGFTPQETADARKLDRQTAEAWCSIALGWPVACGTPELTDESTTHLDTSALDEAVLAATESFIERELVRELSNKDAELLQKCSILEKIEPGVYHALNLGAPWSRLVNLIESGIPTVVAERYCDELVIHPLVRRYLAKRLRAWTPRSHTQLNRIAADYYLALGDTSKALSQVANITDAEVIADIADRAGGWRASLVDGFASLRVANRFDDELIHRHPRAALARIYWKAQSGRVQEAAYELSQFRERSPHSAPDADMATMAAVISIYEDVPVNASQVDALRQPPPDKHSAEPLLEPSCGTLLAALHNNAGERQQAFAVSTSAISLAEQLGSAYVEFYGRWQQALALQGIGRVHEANAAYAKLGILAESLFGDASNEARLVGLTAAHSLIVEGRLSEADAAGDDLGGLFRLHSWFDVYTHALKASVALAELRGGTTHKRAVLDEFRAIATSRGIVRLEVMICLQEVRAALREADPDTAQERLSTAVHCCEALEGSWGRHHVTVWPALIIEEARLQLFRGTFSSAGTDLDYLLHHSQTAIDCEYRLEGLLLAAYAAMGRRRLREVAEYLAQATQLASDSQLLGPFRDPLNYAPHMLAFVSEHAVPIDATTQRRLYRLLDVTDDTMNHEFRGSAQSGLLLTDRETDVVVLLAEGLSSKEIARRLDIGEGTVRTHRKHLYRKLGASRRSQAIMKARELHLV